MELINDSVFRDLVGDFLAAPFSKANQFESKDLETICAEILSYKKDPDWERSYSSLCLMLIHLDTLGLEEFPAMALKDIAQPSPEIEETGFELRKEALELCWKLKQKLSEHYQSIHQDYQQICATQNSLELHQWALCMLSLGNSTLAQLLFRIRKKEEQAQIGHPTLSFVGLMELKKEFNEAMLDLERADLSKAA